MNHNSESTENFLLDGLTILLADDEKRLLQILVMMIEELGGKVISVSSGEEALRIYRERREEIDVVMLDMRMKGMSGGTAFESIISDDPDARIILSSGVRPREKLLDSLAAHGCVFIEKPFDMDMLAQTVLSIVGGDINHR
jgi:two-component system cell cycle sensor histidine kinase/response regulator CckA